MITMITTFFGVGKLRPAPGTWGSAAAVLLAVLMGSEKMLGVERPLVLTGNKKSCYNSRLC